MKWLRKLQLLFDTSQLALSVAFGATISIGIMSSLASIMMGFAALFYYPLYALGFFIFGLIAGVSIGVAYYLYGEYF